MPIFKYFYAKYYFIEFDTVLSSCFCINACFFILYFLIICSLSVRVVQSSRAGVGKSLIVKRLAEKLENLQNNKRLRPGLVSSLCQTIPVHGLSADSNILTRALSAHAVNADIPVSRIFHIDISQTVCITPTTFLYHVMLKKYRTLYSRAPIES